MHEWYVLHTKPRKEFQVANWLARRGIEVYVPALPRLASLRSARAFFPGYIFARADLDAVGLWAIHYVPGNRGVVMFGGQPAPIKDETIAYIKERLARADVLDAAGEILAPGDRVRITAGPFGDLEAVFDRRLSPAGRARVLIQLLHRWTAVELDLRLLRKTRR